MDQNRYSNVYTAVSARQWDFISQDNLTAKEAVAFLLDGIQLRSFRDILRQVCGTDMVERQLTEGLLAMAPPNVHPDSIRRKIRNWMNGKALPTDREDVFQICFSLALEPEQAERMLTFLTDQGIHYRNPREMVYAYCLRYHLGYRHACRLAEQMTGPKYAANTHREPVTQVIHRQFQDVRAEEDLYSFMLRHQPFLGSTHNTAYGYFCQMLTLLTGEDLEGEGRYSMEYVADTYLRMNVPQEKRSARYNDIQKMVKKYWPGPRSIKAMKARSEDVTRKTLLLLYLVTGGIWNQEYDELDETYITAKEFMETHCNRMNQMLRACGMRRMDPRNAFDYMVLYCLRPENDRFMSDRMADLAAELFRE